MIIFPAIDIKNKNVVRLLQGDFEKVSEYSQDPLSVAKKWGNEGAEWLHIVDLDAAQTRGTINNKDLILDIVKKIDVPIQLGGGIRSLLEAEQFLDGGISRIVIGTKAITDKSFLKKILKDRKDNVAVSVDCSNGIVTTAGWTEKSGIKAIDFVKELEDLGLKYLIYTDIARDGMLSGPNLQALKELLDKTKIPIIASGGIKDINDIKKLKELEKDGIIGAITGKSIYEGTLDLKEAISIAK